MELSKSDFGSYFYNAKKKSVIFGSRAAALRQGNVTTNGS